MTAIFCASTPSTAPAGIGRRVTWEEHESGRVSAVAFESWDEDGSLSLDHRGIFSMALRKGYVPSAPAALLDRLIESIEIGGPTFGNVSALLGLCEIPPDAERVPMRRGDVSLSP